MSKLDAVLVGIVGLARSSSPRATTTKLPSQKAIAIGPKEKIGPWQKLHMVRTPLFPPYKCPSMLFACGQIICVAPDPDFCGIMSMVLVNFPLLDPSQQCGVLSSVCIGLTEPGLWAVSSSPSSGPECAAQALVAARAEGELCLARRLVHRTLPD